VLEARMHVGRKTGQVCCEWRVFCNGLLKERDDVVMDGVGVRLKCRKHERKQALVAWHEWRSAATNWQQERAERKVELRARTAARQQQRKKTAKAGRKKKKKKTRNSERQAQTANDETKPRS
jgi:hypothetical protein